MKRDIHVIRESITKVVAMLVGRGLTVTQRGMRAFVAYHPKTGEILSVNIPYLPDDASDEFIAAIQGFLDHEVGHVLYTDNEVVKKAAKAGSRIANIHNIIEDIYIERKMQQGFRGAVTNLDTMRRFFFEKSCAGALQKELDAGNVEGARGYAMVMAFRAWGGQTLFKDLIKQPHIAELVEPITKKMGPDLIDAMGRCNSSQECFDLAKRVTKALEKKEPPKPKAPPPPAPPPPPEEDEEKEERPGGGDAGTGDTDDSKPEPEDKGTEKTETDDSGKGDEDHDRSEADGKEDKPEAGDSEGTDEGAPSAGSDEQDDAEDDADKGDANPGGAGGDEDKDDEDADGKGGDLDEPAKPDEASEGEKDKDTDADGDGDGEADSTTDEAAPGAGGDGDEDREDDATEPGKGEGERGDGDDGDDDDHDAAVGTASDKGDEDKKDGEASDDAGKGAESEAGEKGDSTGDHVDDAEDEQPDLGSLADTRHDFDEDMSDVLTKEAGKELMDAEYKVFTGDFDCIGEEAPKTSDASLIEKMMDETTAAVGVMAKSLERAMAAQNRKAWNPGLRKGRINPGSLFRTGVGDDRVFRQRVETRAKNTVVELVVDCSGSMSWGGKIATAGTAAYALSTTLERIKIQHEVIGFTTKGSSELMEAAEEEFKRTRVRVPYSRLLPLYMPVFKGWNERLDADTRARFANLRSGRPGFLHENVDGESVLIAGHRLMQQKAERHVMIVLSDGSPACPPGYGLNRHLKGAVKKLEAAGIDVIGIGLEDDSVKEFYRKYLVLNDVSELATTLIGQLTTLLLAD